jgi:hypothetical protein
MMHSLIMVTQVVTKAQVVQFWYGIMEKELKHRVWDAILLQLA